MKNLFKFFTVLAFVFFSTTGYASDKIQIKDEAARQVSETAGRDINTSDFKYAIRPAVQNMLRSGALDSLRENRYIVTVSRVADMTGKKIDTAVVVDKISSELERSGKVQVVSANPEEEQKITPEITVSGKITQRTAHIRGKKRIEYYLHLNLSEIKSGMTLWENATPVLIRK